MDNLEKLKSKRKIIKTACTKLMTKIESSFEAIDFKNESNFEQLSDFLSNLEEKQSELKSINSKIEELITDVKVFENEVQNSLDYDQSMIEIKFKIKTRLKKFKINSDLGDTSTVSNVSTEISDTSKGQKAINLPKIKIPIFKGEDNTFLEFINTFKGTIDINESLSNVDKLIYLKSFLSGEAYKTISGLSLTDKNYETSLDLLENRYGKKECLISGFINKLLELEPVKSSFNTKQLRILYDECEISIRNLQSIGVASDDFGYLLIPIILKQMPHNLVVEYQRKRDKNKSGDVKELMNFIRFEIESREAANAVSGISLKNHETSRWERKTPSKITGNVPTSAALNTIVKNVCIFCNSNHYSLKCNEISDQQKRYKLKKEGRCYRCLNKRHLLSQCKVKIQPCENCKSFQHNYLFCPDKKPKISLPKENGESPPETSHFSENQTVLSSVIKTQNPSENYTTLLQTAFVEVENSSKKLFTRLLYDSGSSRTFITKSLAQALQLKPVNKEKLLVYTFASRNALEKEFDVVNITLRSRFPPFATINLKALVSDVISGARILASVDSKMINRLGLNDSNFADSFIETRPVQILLGADYMFSTIRGEVKKVNKSLFIQPTIFGQTLAGRLYGNNSQNTSCFKVICSSVDNDLRNLWQLESFLFTEKEKENDEHLDAINKFDSQICFKNGRYIAPLLWESDMARENLSDNYEVAEKRFAVLERQLKGDQSLFLRYNEVMKEQLNEGIIQKCNDDCSVNYVMPHRAVFRENSSSSKTRIVYDCSSRQGTNKSLNECLLPGENLNPNLVDVILSFRQHKIAFSCDIARAFLQIEVSEKDRNYLCFLYFNDCDINEPITRYHFNRHCFGVTSSPYVLASTIKKHIKNYKESNPVAYKMLDNYLYVDDLYSGGSTVSETFKLSADAVSIFKDANMKLRKFDSNSLELKKLWKCADPVIEANENNNSDLKMLGLKWNNKEDTISVDLTAFLSKVESIKCTKRHVLHTAASIFDPLGFISPFIIRIKCLLQELWESGIDWDDTFSGEMKEKYETWYKEIELLEKINIPRYYFDINSTKENNVQLHLFSDASLKAYGAVAYFRYETSQGKFKTNFVFSKARVAPLKRITLPRLELLGALIAARTAKHLRNLFNNIETIILWSDSNIALHWIKGSASKWKPFVGNRVTEIQGATDPSSWRYVNTKDNPADMLTRGLSSKELMNSNKWYHGPEWLTNPETMWPKENKVKIKSFTPEIKSECKKEIVINTIIVTEKIIDIDKFSSLKKLLRVTAYVFRFVNILKGKQKKNCALTSDELREAELFWIKTVQNDFFADEIRNLRNKKPLPKDSNLLCLNPFLDSEDVLRVSGRLGKTEFSTDEKHPIILPPTTKFSELIIWDAHFRVYHSAVSHTLVQVREKFWLLRARQTIKNLLKKCVICKRFSAIPGDQMVAPLPPDRVEQAAPFTVIGIDFAGPLFVKDSENKQYILLITCAVTRNVHLELVDNLSTETFLLAFRRFIARRGLCSVVYSDNARTFKRAEIELKKLWTILDHPDVKEFYTSNNIKWKYIVERAAWWGGFYERMVRTVKVALRKTLGKSSLTTNQLHTVLIEIEGVVNSRPITYVCSDNQELSPLSPAHFLIGRRISSLPPVRLHLDSNFSSRKELLKAFNYREKLMRLFWSRWRGEYLLNLRSAHQSLTKTNLPQFKLNDIVLIKDDHLPRNFWSLGRIIEIFPGRDGKVRACKIKTEKSVIKRPVQLLYNLELKTENDSEH